MDDCRRSLLSSLDSLGDSLGGLESWYYGQILRDEALAPPEYGKVLTNAVTADEVTQCCKLPLLCWLHADGKRGGGKRMMEHAEHSPAAIREKATGAVNCEYQSRSS